MGGPRIPNKAIFVADGSLLIIVLHALRIRSTVVQFAPRSIFHILVQFRIATVKTCGGVSGGLELLFVPSLYFRWPPEQ